MQTSEHIDQLATALSKAQAEMKNPAFDSNNPAFRSKYASLASVRDTVMPVLTKHGLSLVQNISATDNVVRCSNKLMHLSGQWLETDCMAVPADKHNAHGYGSACTYARRFSLMSLVNVVGDDDDDGNAASAKPAPEKKPAELDPAIVSALKAAADLNALAAVWKGINTGIRHEYATIKDARKAELSNG